MAPETPLGTGIALDAVITRRWPKVAGVVMQRVESMCISIFSPEIRRDVAWHCPNCTHDVRVWEVGLTPCPNCGWEPRLWHTVFDTIGPEGG